jgi:hypothetical protein
MNIFPMNIFTIIDYEQFSNYEHFYNMNILQTKNFFQNINILSNSEHFLLCYGQFINMDHEQF